MIFQQLWEIFGCISLDVSERKVTGAPHTIYIQTNRAAVTAARRHEPRQGARDSVSNDFFGWFKLIFRLLIYQSMTLEGRITHIS